MECYLLPIDKILISADESLIAECTACDRGSFRSLKELMEASCFYMDDESVAVLRTFTSEFGVGYRTEQLRSCERCISELMKQRERSKEKSISERRVRLALCLCASLSIVLLLI